MHAQRIWVHFWECLRKIGYHYMLGCLVTYDSPDAVLSELPFGTNVNIPNVMGTFKKCYCNWK